MFSPKQLESAGSKPNVVAVTPRSILKKSSAASLTNVAVASLPAIKPPPSSPPQTEVIPSIIIRLIHPDLDNGDRTDAYTFLSTKIRSYSEGEQVDFLKPHAEDLIRNLRLDIAGTRTRSSVMDEKLVSAALKCLGYVAYHEHLVVVFTDRDLSDTLNLLLDRFAEPNLPKNIMNLIIWNLGMQRFPHRVVKPHVLRLLNAFVQGLRNNYKSVTIQSESLGGIYNLVKFSPAEACREAKVWVGPLLKCLISKTTAVRYKALQLCSNTLEAIVGLHGHHVHAAVVKFMKEPTGEGEKQMQIFEKYMIDTVQSDEEPKYAVQLWSTLVTWHGNNLHNPSSDIKLFLSIIEICFNRPMTVCASHRAWVRLAHAFACKDSGNFLINVKRLRLLRQPIQSALTLERDEAGQYSIQPGKAKIRLAAATGALSVAYACMSPCIVPTNTTNNKEAWAKMDMVWEEFVRPTLNLLLIQARPGTNPPTSSDPPLISSSPVTSTDSTSSSMSEEARKAATRAVTMCNAPRQLGLRLLAALLQENAISEWKVDRLVLTSLAPEGVDMSIISGGEDLIVAPEEIAHIDPRWIRSHSKEILEMMPFDSDLPAFTNFLKSLHGINQKEIQPSVDATQSIQDVCYFVSKAWTSTMNLDLWLQLTTVVVQTLSLKSLAGKKLKWDLAGSNTGSMTPIVYLTSAIVANLNDTGNTVAKAIRLGCGGSQQSSWEYITSMTKLVTAKLAKAEIDVLSWLVWWSELATMVNSFLDKAIKEELDINPFRGIASDTSEKHPHEEKQWVVFELLASLLKIHIDSDSAALNVWINLLQTAVGAAHLHHRDSNVVIIDEVAKRVDVNLEGKPSRHVLDAITAMLSNVQVIMQPIKTSKSKQQPDPAINPLSHLCSLVSKILAYALPPLDANMKTVNALADLLKRVAQPYSRPFALSMQEGVSNLLKGSTSERTFDLWQAYLAAAIACTPSELSNNDLVEIEGILLIGLKSDQTDIVNHTLTIWNETFGTLPKLDYSQNLKKIFTQLRKTAIISLPSWPTSAKQKQATGEEQRDVSGKRPQLQFADEPLSLSVASQEIERNVDDEFRSQMPSRKRKARITSGQPSPPLSSLPADGDARSPAPVNATNGPRRRRTSSFVPSTSPRKTRRKPSIVQREDSQTTYTVIPRKLDDSPPRLDTIQVEPSDDESVHRPVKKRRARNVPKLYSALDDSQSQEQANVSQSNEVAEVQNATPRNVNKREVRRLRRASMVHPAAEYASPVLETPAVLQEATPPNEKCVPDSANLDRFITETSFGVSLGDPPSDEIGEPDSPSRMQAKRRRMSMSQPPISCERTVPMPRQEASEPPSSPRRSPRRSLMPDMIASDDSDAPRGAFSRRRSMIPKLIPSSMPEEAASNEAAQMSIIHEDSREIIDDTQMQIDNFMQDAKALADRGQVLAKMDAKELHLLQRTLNELWGGVVTAMGDRMGVKL